MTGEGNRNKRRVEKEKMEGEERSVMNEMVMKDKRKSKTAIKYHHAHKETLKCIERHKRP